MARARRTALVAAIVWWALAAPRTPAAPARPAIVIIVNAGNPAPDPSLDDLRALFLLERQFWPDGRRVALYLPPAGSPERDTMLDRIYSMSDFELRKYWVGKLFRGAIPSIPSTLPSREAAVAAVEESRAGIAAIGAGDVPPTVRVLRIDGKQPGDPGYPLGAGRVP